MLIMKLLKRDTDSLVLEMQCLLNNKIRPNWGPWNEKKYKTNFYKNSAFMWNFIINRYTFGNTFGYIRYFKRSLWAYIIDFANPVNYEQLNNFLAQILLLVIAVELVIMLCLHRPETLLEVLLYAIARKLLLIPKSSSAGELLLGVLAIAAIFFIKKYLIPTNNKNNDNNDNNEQKNSIKSIIASYLKDDDDNVSMF